MDIIKLIKKHQIESALVGFGVIALVYIHHRHLSLATTRLQGGVGSGKTMDVIRNVPSIVKPTPDRMSQQEPERFTQFDHRFEFDRLSKGAVDFRTELDDDEKRRFLPRILSARGVDIPLLEFIFGLAYNDEISEECVTYPDSPGIWEIATNGCWVPVTQADELLIEQIARERGDRQAPVVIM